MSQPLLRTLPDVVHLPAGQGQAGSPTQAAEAVLAMLCGELGRADPGADLAVDRLLDVLLVHILRTWVAHPDAPESRSWLTGLREPVAAGALSAMHADPARPWTAAELAASVGVSRATLNRRFTDAVGTPPLAYLTAWRLDLAALRLRTTDDPVDRVAHAVGYTSEFAFSRAFSRGHGMPPGRYRSISR